MTRPDGRHSNQLRPIQIKPSFQTQAQGAVIFGIGNTLVHCAATLEEKVPPFLDPLTQGWLTSEYSMLPTATGSRSPRDSTRGKVNGRSVEIQRLIGRSCRQALNLSKIPGKTIWLDCDVLQADGGTRTAAINGSSIALQLVIRKALDEQRIASSPLLHPLAAISAGLFQGIPILDLNYHEDSRADADMNYVTTPDSRVVELQISAEKAPVTPPQLEQLMGLVKEGTQQIFLAQEKFIKENNP